MEKLLIDAHIHAQLNSNKCRNNPVKQMCVCVRERERESALSRVHLFVTPWILAHQAPLSVEFPRHE